MTVHAIFTTNHITYTQDDAWLADRFLLISSLSITQYVCYNCTTPPAPEETNTVKTLINSFI